MTSMLASEESLCSKSNVAESGWQEWEQLDDSLIQSICRVPRPHESDQKDEQT